MLTEQHSHRIGTGIAPPGTQENKPHQILSVLKSFSGQINKGEHHRPVQPGKHRRHDLLRLIPGKSEHIRKKKHDHGKHHRDHNDRIYLCQYIRLLPADIQCHKKKAVIQNRHDHAHSFRRIPFRMHAACPDQFPVGDERYQTQDHSQNAVPGHDRCQRDDHQQNTAQQSSTKHITAPSYSSLTRPYRLSLLLYAMIAFSNSSREKSGHATGVKYSSV